MRLLSMILLMFNIHSALANELLLRPLPAGGWSITQGAVTDMAPNIVSQPQPAGKALVIQIMPAGYGTCEGNRLSGLGRLSSVNISFSAVSGSGKHSSEMMSCGQSINITGPTELQRPAVKAEIVNVDKRAFKSDLQELYGQKILLGSITFINEGNRPVIHHIYLDLTLLPTAAPALQASFNKATLLLGEVNAFRDARQRLMLSISKTQYAGNLAQPYILKFESSQMKDNSYQLKSVQGDIHVPYKVMIHDVNISPGDEYRGVVAAGEATSDIVQIEFLLPSTQVGGIAAGTKLSDVLTAVIIPDS
ncbi:hypothetical protein WN53_03065 [Serratia fonticola]|uniref:hypothetical protein n=1 Tax=Serratia fonticola TaxID=47917 RepID=UPI0004172087|nr:hypothetical protein [Serratia fonticola]AKG68199.1 hypothetical protein WN53_03065 [Serratia fonticola]CAI1953789.1 Uncharacterised protein [Serratia fonticola]